MTVFVKKKELAAHIEGIATHEVEARRLKYSLTLFLEGNGGSLSQWSELIDELSSSGGGRSARHIRRSSVADQIDYMVKQAVKRRKTSLEDQIAYKESTER